jgi:hypothetical protein
MFDRLTSFAVTNVTVGEVAERLVEVHRKAFPDREPFSVVVVAPGCVPKGPGGTQRITATFKDAEVREIITVVSQLIFAKVYVIERSVVLDPWGTQDINLGTRYVTISNVLTGLLARGEAKVDLKGWFEERGVIFAPEGGACLLLQKKTIVMTNYAEELVLMEALLKLAARKESEEQKRLGAGP